MKGCLRRDDRSHHKSRNSPLVGRFVIELNEDHRLKNLFVPVPERPHLSIRDPSSRSYLASCRDSLRGLLPGYPGLGPLLDELKIQIDPSPSLPVPMLASTTGPPSDPGPPAPDEPDPLFPGDMWEPGEYEWEFIDPFVYSSSFGLGGRVDG